MSCQTESEGSFDGASDWSSCEGSAGDELVESVEETWNLVSGGLVRLWVVVDGAGETIQSEQNEYNLGIKRGL